MSLPARHQCFLVSFLTYCLQFAKLMGTFGSGIKNYIFNRADKIWGNKMVLLVNFVEEQSQQMPPEQHCKRKTSFEETMTDGPSPFKDRL